ncbi:MAG TPA: magnesium transporter CorA [Xanthomonadaceae bacterium]|jgi:magnesium transporter|nr:magnesium transporter CorA [Xanthomonadaceae bacterium]
MIRFLQRIDGRLQQHDGLPATTTDGIPLWIDAAGADDGTLAALRERFGIDPQLQHSSIHEDDDYLYVFAELVAMNEQRQPGFHRVTFVLGERLLVTLHDSPEFAPMQRALQRLGRRPALAADPKSTLRVLLSAINDGTSQVIERIAETLESTADTIAGLSAGAGGAGRGLGVSDLTETLLDLNESEELISRCLESQLALARVARYLNGEVDSLRERELQVLVEELMLDIGGVKEHAAFEHDKVRYLQNAVVGLLTIKQNQIVKVFTVITAVFLPPTLVATFYGMNFAVMPELAWEHGFTASILLTFAAALLPLVYIKRKGWLR